MTRNTDILSSAIKFREAGLAVHWLKPRSKIPAGGENWQDAPVATAEQLRATYRPGFNVGLRTGEPSLVGGYYLHVIDTDVRMPDLADEAWAAFDRLLPGIRETLPSVVSGSGGESRHHFLLTDKPFFGKKLAVSEDKFRSADGKWKNCWEVDLFGTGRQVVLPGSIHPDTGLPYRWEREFEVDGFDQPIVSSAIIEALGVADTTTYAFESRDPLDFKPGQLEADLDVLPVSRWDDRSDWVMIGQALHHQFGGSEEGFALWERFSAKSAKCDKDFRRANLRRWRTFGRNRRQPVTMGTVRQWAMQQRNALLATEFEDLDELPSEAAAPGGNEFDALMGSAAGGDDWDGGSDEGASTADLPAWVIEMNEKHALAFVEGKSVILSEKPDGGVAYGSVADLHALYENKRRATERSSEPVSKAWMRHRGRATYPNGIVFAPAGETSGAFNHWRGFAVEPSASGSCSLFLEHLRDVVCGGDAIAYRWLLRWFAHMVQKPGEKPGTAVVLKGRKGTGKDTVAEYVGGLFPRHHTKIANAEHLYGKFNAHQEKTLLLHVEEGFWAGNKQAEASLKYVITSEQVQIEPKGVNAFQVPSVLRVFISSNEDWVVPATFDERRFFVMNVRGEKRAPGYFSALRTEMVNGGRPALLHYLQRLDLSDFDVRNPPMTDGLRDQKLQSLRNIEKWWYELLTSEELPGMVPTSLDDEQSAGWSQMVEVGRGTLRGNYREWMRGNRFEGSVLTEAEFGKRMKDLIPTMTSSRPRSQGGARQRLYQVPALQQCRAQFETRVGLSIDWQ